MQGVLTAIVVLLALVFTGAWVVLTVLMWRMVSALETREEIVTRGLGETNRMLLAGVLAKAAGGDRVTGLAVHELLKRVGSDVTIGETASDDVDLTVDDTAVEETAAL